jgi:hypothetical protein
MGIDGMRPGCDEVSRRTLAGVHPDSNRTAPVRAASIRLRHGAVVPPSQSWHHTQIWVIQQRRRCRHQPHRLAYGPAHR